MSPRIDALTWMSSKSWLCGGSWCVDAIQPFLHFSPISALSQPHPSPDPAGDRLGREYLHECRTTYGLKPKLIIIYFHTEVLREIITNKMIIIFICPTSLHVFSFRPFVFVHITNTVFIYRFLGGSLSGVPLDTTPKIILYFIRDNKQTSYYYSIIFFLPFILENVNLSKNLFFEILKDF
jgi:hypothetical protein